MRKILQVCRNTLRSSLKGSSLKGLRRTTHVSAKAWRSAPDKLHLGCGSKAYPGWANIDSNGGDGIIQHDLNQDFPLSEETVRFIYAEHLIEHISRDEALTLLKECHRELRPNGVIRLSTPSLEKLTDEYLAGRTTEWSDVDWLPRTSCQLLNEGLRLWEHQFVYDLNELTLLLKEAGFQCATRVAWRDSKHPELRDLESRPFHDEIIVEAVK